MHPPPSSSKVILIGHGRFETNTLGRIVVDELRQEMEQEMQEAKTKQEQIFQDTIADQQAQIQASQDKSWCVVM